MSGITNNNNSHSMINYEALESINRELNLKKGIYSLEFIRQIGTVFSSCVLMGGATLAGGVIGCLAPLVLLVTGPATMKAAAGHLRDSYKAIEAATASEAKTIAKWGLANQVMFFLMGVFRSISAGVLTCESIHTISAPALAIKAGLGVAFISLHCIASCVYAVRGVILAYHAQKNLDLINEFSEDFAKAGDKTIFMEGAVSKGDEYLGLRLDLKYWAGMLSPSDTDEESLKKVQKAITSHQLKYTAAKRAGLLMIAGAILSATGVVALSIGSAGIFPLIAMLGAALFFACAEVHFLIFYSQKLFEKYRDWGSAAAPQEIAPVVRMAPTGAAVSSPINEPKEGRRTHYPSLPFVADAWQNAMSWISLKIWRTES